MTRWEGCYADSWQDLITPESFGHPAKFSRGLIHQIYRHLLEQGYLTKGDTVLDPFGGVGLGALDALTYGLGWIGCELEERFFTLGNANLAKWRQEYGFTGGVLLHGDSRQLRAVLAGAAAQGVVGSPPFQPAGTQPSGHHQYVSQAYAAGMAKEAKSRTTYGTTPGQLGALPAGSLETVLEGVVSSPPYAGAGSILGTHNGIDYTKCQPGTGTRTTPARNAIGAGGYGTTPGQLAQMPAGCVGMKLGYIDLASTENSDRITGSILSERKEDACPPVKSAEKKSPDEAAGASCVAENTSAPRLKGEQSPQDTAQKLLQHATTSPPLNVGEHHTRTGQGEAHPGADMPGESNAARPWSVTTTAAHAVEQPNDYKSTISETKNKQTVPGITALKISKPSVQHVTLPTIEENSLTPSALSAARSPKGKRQKKAVQMPAEKKSIAVPQKNTTINKEKDTSAKNAGGQSLSEADDIISAQTLASQKPCENETVNDQEAQDAQNTFWGASAQILHELYHLLPPGAPCVWVVKPYVKNKKIVPFDTQWQTLCESHGFVTKEIISAMLVEEHGTQEALFGGAERVFTKKASFFRRLAEKKGSPAIDAEIVLITTRGA